jgi:hypothetical protein
MRSPHMPYRSQSVAALVLGCASAFFWFAFAVLPLLAIAFAGQAMKGQRRLGYRISGMAIAGLVLGIVFMSMFVLVVFSKLSSGTLGGGN